MKTYQVNKFVLVYGGLVLLPLSASAQFTGQDDVEAGKLELFKDIRYNVEMQGSFSKGKTPLWLNANKYGLSSMEKNNGYLRGCVISFAHNRFVSLLGNWLWVGHRCPYPLYE